MTKVRPIRIQPYLDPPLHQRLKSFCAATASTESAVVKRSLHRLLDQTDDMTLLMRRLDRLGRISARIHRDLELLTEAFSLWLRMWFSLTPNVADNPEAKRAARATGERRFLQYTASLAERFARGGRFINDLPQEAIPDPVDFDADADAAGPAAAPPPAVKPTGDK